MRDVLREIEAWRAAGEDVAVATVLETWGSAPRAAGARMAVTASGQVAGSVSGGCVEGAVVEAGRETLRTGKPRRLHFGVADDTAWAVGLACGGSIDVFVEKLDPKSFEPIRDALRAERPVASVTVVGGPDEMLGKKRVLLENGRSEGSLGGGLDETASEAARAALSEGSIRRVTAGGVELFAEALMPSPTLVAVGGVHIAVALVALAKTLGYRTVVVDPRTAFGNADRFPGVDRLMTDWPDAALRGIGLNASTAVAVLTHDPKLDDPALSVALRSPAFYVGALGSKKTQEKRRRRLLDGGLTEEELSRLHAPIGLPLGGRTPEEIALAVMAQIVATRNQRSRSPSDGRSKASPGERGPL
jgi:xanthine dehydrogenase accessory factor